MKKRDRKLLTLILAAILIPANSLEYVYADELIVDEFFDSEFVDEEYSNNESEEFNLNNTEADYTEETLDVDDSHENKTINSDTSDESKNVDEENILEDADTNINSVYGVDTEEDTLENDSQAKEKSEEEFPNIVGKTRKEVEELLDEINFPIDNVIFRYKITDEYEDDTVISQSIEEGALYDEESKITIELCSHEIETSDDSNISLLNHYELADKYTESPSIDDGTWSGYPCSYEYNWDNSDSCWNWGVWGGNGNLKGYTTEEGNYDVNVRHKMAMYCDGTDLVIYVQYASCYSAPGNGDDFNITIDGENAKIRVIYDDGGSLTGRRDEGSYDIKVIHENTYPSGSEVLGATGQMVVNKDNINNELEFRFPLEELKRQNENINLDSFQQVEMYNPNLMYRHISCGGASSGSPGFILITVTIFGLTFYINRKKFGLEME